MIVYVIYDPLLETVLCVHEKAGMVCRTCDKKKYHERCAYQLCECKRKVITKC